MASQVKLQYGSEWGAAVSRDLAKFGVHLPRFDFFFQEPLADAGSRVVSDTGNLLKSAFKDVVPERLRLDAFAVYTDMVKMLEYWPTLLYTGVVSTGLCQVLELVGLQGVRASTASLIYGTVPVWGALTAVALLDERLSTLSMCGGVFIVGAALSPALFPDDTTVPEETDNNIQVTDLSVDEMAEKLSNDFQNSPSENLNIKSTDQAPAEAETLSTSEKKEKLIRDFAQTVESDKSPDAGVEIYEQVELEDLETLSVDIPEAETLSLKEKKEQRSFEEKENEILSPEESCSSGLLEIEKKPDVNGFDMGTNHPDIMINNGKNTGPNGGIDVVSRDDDAEELTGS